MRIMTPEADILNYRIHLEEMEKSASTIRAYMHTVNEFIDIYGDINSKNLIEYKKTLISRYHPRSINRYICAINSYISYKDLNVRKLKQVKVGQTGFIDNTITDEQYRYLLSRLSDEYEWTIFYMVHFMASTGMRVSEVLELKRADIEAGYRDVLSKGNRMRRVYIPDLLRNDALKWLDNEHIITGYIFLNKRGNHMTDSGLRSRLRHFAVKYDIPTDVMHPHSFRHLFAKLFLRNCSDITLLADLLGHEKLDTTRIYLKASSDEQRRIIDHIVTW